LPRKTDANNPADWLWIAGIDLELLQMAAEREVSFITVCSKLAEVLEKILKAELLRLGWKLVKTHDLRFLARELRDRQSDLFTTFDFDDPDWPALRAQLAQVVALHAAVQARVAPPSSSGPA
jgi:hypothetical protein